MTPAIRRRSPFRGMLVGLGVGSLAAGVAAVLAGAAALGVPGAASAGTGFLVSLSLMALAVVGTKLVVGLTGPLPLLGAVVVLTTTLVVMGLYRAFLLDLDWLHRRTFALAAAGTVVLGQAGLAAGLLRSRSPLLGDV